MIALVDAVRVGGLGARKACALRAATPDAGWPRSAIARWHQQQAAQRDIVIVLDGMRITDSNRSHARRVLPTTRCDRIRSYPLPPNAQGHASSALRAVAQRRVVCPPQVPTSDEPALQGRPNGLYGVSRSAVITLERARILVGDQRPSHRSHFRRRPAACRAGACWS
jgi:hypothetical protein